MKTQNCKIACNTKGSSSLNAFIAFLAIGAVAVGFYTSFSSPGEDEAASAMAEKVTKTTSVVPKVASVSTGLQKYSSSAYQDALADGKTVLLDFHADWCSTCVGNSPKLDSAFKALDDSNTVAFKVNYDTESSLKKQFSVVSQATYILLRDGKEVKRVMGSQSTDQFKQLLSA